jgi:two-component system, OmpR family, response regulator RegX3
METIATLYKPDLRIGAAPGHHAATAGSSSMRVAIVEDDLSQAELLTHWLELAGHHCCHFDRGEAVIRALDQNGVDALVLDWNLPDISGVEVLRRIRNSQQSTLPVLFVTGRSRENDVVTALQQGADDYMIKPVRGLELIARLEAVIRRGRHRPEEPQVLEMDGFRVDCQGRTLTRNGTPVELTTKDFDLAVLLLRNVGRLLSRAHIRESVWGRKAVVSSRTLDTHISRIRNRLRLTPENGWHLVAVYRHGYRLDHLDGEAAAYAQGLAHANAKEPSIKRLLSSSWT